MCACRELGGDIQIPRYYYSLFNVGILVSRIGLVALIMAIKQIAGKLKLAQFIELEASIQFNWLICKIFTSLSISKMLEFI